MKKVAILQSSYIPWKGYFDIINSVDYFVFYDDVQYTKDDWRNRNRIKTRDGLKWLTIPVKVKGRFGQRIMDAVASDSVWRKKHWKSLCQWYSKTLYFKTYREIFEQLYLGETEVFLSKINYDFIDAICKILGIKTKFVWSSDFTLPKEKTERLVEICRNLNATEYLSGPAAKNYLKKEKFENAGIKVTYMDYSGYPEYMQLFPPFEHHVTILDLIFNKGNHAIKYMKSFMQT